MTWARTALGGAAVALLVAGCSATGAATESAKPADDADQTATVADTAAAAESASGEWVDVTGQGPQLPKDSDGNRYSATPAAGVVIFHWPSGGGGEAGGCTLGPAVHEVGGDRSGFLTAGHCGEGEYTPEQYLASGPGPDDVVAQPLGSMKRVDGGADVGVIWTSQAPNSSTIGGFPVVGVMSEADLKALPKGTDVCVDGAVSGVTCAKFYGADDAIHYGHTQPGDSGAPVFLVNQKREAVLIGVHTGAYTAAILDRVLSRNGLATVTAS